MTRTDAFHIRLVNALEIEVLILNVDRSKGGLTRHLSIGDHKRGVFLIQDLDLAPHVGRLDPSSHGGDKPKYDTLIEGGEFIPR